MIPINRMKFFNITYLPTKLSTQLGQYVTKVLANDNEFAHFKYLFIEIERIGNLVINVTFVKLLQKTGNEIDLQCVRKGLKSVDRE